MKIWAPICSATVCPFKAIEMTAHGLAIVHAELCVGCGKCVPSCPRNLIQFVPRTIEDILAFIRDPQAPLPSGAPAIPARLAPSGAAHAAAGL